MHTIGRQMGALLDDNTVTTSIGQLARDACMQINPLHYNPYTDDQWKAKVQQFDRSLEPYIRRVVPILKRRLQSIDQHKQQVE